jgi:ATP-dependent DNA helicase RecQ
MPSPPLFKPSGFRPSPAPARQMPARAPAAGGVFPAGPRPAILATAGRDPAAILKDVFGYGSFRGDQGDAVSHVTEGGDAIVLMPTGGGKSLCYQVPALARHGMAVIISPLVALMQDQVGRLRECGVAAEKLNSDMTWEERSRVTRDIGAGKVKLLYVAPERFATEDFQALLRRTELAMFAIDEAHCVSQWGHAFRPDYMEIGRITAEFPEVPRIAVTATASPSVRVDMVKHLRLEGARVFLSSFDRPNITYQIAEQHSQNTQLLDFLAGHQGESGIVYCLSRKKTEAVAALLREHGHDAFAYHARLDPAVKRASLDRFLKQEEGVIACATIAFGMGIDKPDVRFVAHMDLPDSLEAYYQETGRAGRDGKPAVAWMCYGLDSLRTRRQMIFDDPGNSAAYKQLAWQRLQALVSMIESPGCRRGCILRYFGEAHEGNCGNCDRCLSPVQTFGGEEAKLTVQKLLSAVARTGGKFGLAHVVDVVTGNRTEKAVACRHNMLSCFGCGADRPKEWWAHIARQLYAGDLLASPPDAAYGYQMTAKGIAAMRGESAVRLVEPPPRWRRNRAAVPPGRKLDLAAGVPPERRQLFEDLRKMRSGAAAARDLPAFMIFGDATLVDIVQAMPDTLSQLRQIPGIGESKMFRYGQELLAIVGRHRHAPRPDRISVPGIPMC